ncbi:Type IV secretion system protein virB8 [Oligella sp. MSHR50489EDL]|uniref:virB8 family protein n=1 Tax=Oligella TaxID=90243 RepID=UPI000CFF90FB|nr:type IV secretion system protein [Oligella urethralis]AVL70622.1 type VI secretion protein [Oligella urethralis]
MLFKKKNKEENSTEKKVKKQTPTQATNTFIQSAKNFEKTRIESIKRSNKIAWGITSAAVLMTLVSVTAVAMLAPLKTVEPFVVRVDDSTGIVDIVTTMKNHEETYGEVVDRYWLTQYVKYREGYDWWTVQASYDATMLMSGTAEKNAMSAFFQSDVAPYKVFKDRFRADIRIISTTWIGQTAQVRFEKTVKPLLNDNQEPIKQKLIATIGYKYTNTPQAESDRLINPLGLQVMSYRVDTED